MEGLDAPTAYPNHGITMERKNQWLDYPEATGALDVMLGSLDATVLDTSTHKGVEFS
jgi:hypothetical protein